MGIKSILNALFRRQPETSSLGHNGGPAIPPISNPVVIPTPEGMPPELLQRVPTRQPRDPSRKRKRRTKEEIKADHKAWVEGMLYQARVRFESDRARAESAGATHYRWRTAGDYSVCKTCRSRNGKRFPLRSAADFQHPGFMLCFCEPIEGEDEGRSDPCRCYAEYVFAK